MESKEMKALLLINFQIDFFQGGAVGIDAGQALVDFANALMSQYERVIAIRDWHPAEHQSFASSHLWRRPGQVMQIDGQEQLLWHMHCVQESFGAEWAMGLEVSGIHHVVNKGTNPATDGYSGFAETDLEDYLHSQGVNEVHLIGMAREYDVAYTAADAERLGFEVQVIEEGCRRLG